MCGFQINKKIKDFYCYSKTTCHFQQLYLCFSKQSGILVVVILGFGDEKLKTVGVFTLSNTMISILTEMWPQIRANFSLICSLQTSWWTERNLIQQNQKLGVHLSNLQICHVRGKPVLNYCFTCQAHSLIVQNTTCHDHWKHVQHSKPT